MPAAHSRAAKAAFQPRPTSFALALGLSGLCAAPPVFAQAADSAARETLIDFRIPASELGPALNAFGVQAGITLGFDAPQVQNRRTPGLAGRHSVAQGLGRLLAGSGLTGEHLGGGNWVLRALPPDPATTLPAVKVEAQADRLFEPLPERGGFKADYQDSATKTPLSIRETPQSISVITRESMDLRQVRDLGAALELSAGAVASDRGAFTGAHPSVGDGAVLRGQGSTDQRVDGFLTYYESQPDFALFERVEVVKGPSSTAYGPGSLNGFINRVTKKPQREKHASAVMQLGSFDTRRAEFDLTGALDEKQRVAGRLIAVHEDSGTFVDDAGDLRRSTLAPSLSVDLGTRTRLLLQAYAQEEANTPQAGIPLKLENGELVIPHIPRSKLLGLSTNSRVNGEIDSLTLRADHQLSDRWLSTLLLQDARVRRTYFLDAYAYLLNDDNEAYMYSGASLLDADNWAGELRLDGSFELLGRTHRALLGVEKREQTHWAGNSYQQIGAVNIYDGDFGALTVQPQAVERESASIAATEGLFGQFIFSLTDRTRLIAGLRHDRAEQRLRTGLDTGNLSEQRADKSATTYRVALSQDVGLGLTAFAAYSESFVPVLQRSRSGAVLDPETGEGEELGLKGEWMDQRLSASLTVYRQDRDKVPLLDTQPGDGPGSLFYASSGLQRAEGLEIEMSGTPLPGLTVGLAAAWTDSQHEERSDPDFGQTTYGTIKRQTNLFAHYRIGGGAFTGLGFGATLVSLGDRYAGSDTALGNVPMQGYERVDLTLSYDGLRNWDFGLQVRNVFDERYIERLNRRYAYNYFGSPTAAILRAEYRFDL